MLSAYDEIQAFNAGREPERLAIKMVAMRSGAFPFFRGTCHLYLARQQEAGATVDAPPAWCCNDLHLENFGTYEGDNGLTYFDINDFDEACLAPCTWDLIRFVASLLVAAPSLSIARADAARWARSAARTYLDELATSKARWIERRIATGAIGELIDGLKKRDDIDFLDSRTIRRKRSRELQIDGRRTLSITKDERENLAKAMTSYGRRQKNPEFYRLIDAARRIAGTGSLGIPRYVLLVEGHGSPDGNVLLDFKAAAPSAAVKHSPVAQPSWRSDAERIVAIQQRCQAISPANLHAVAMNAVPYVIKQLQPTSDRLDLPRIARDGALRDTLTAMTKLIAWSHVRSSGRGGSASADALSDFATKDGIVDQIVAAAVRMAEQALKDYSSFSKDYDAAGGVKPLQKKKASRKR